ncbi:hypothetical protein KR009_003193 [Drosophila setifemur]|nr:hypothetical protein KR009_003193 [Drosophila setifemur]
MSVTHGEAQSYLRHFITRSSYEGAWDKAVNVMDGFGSYRYPDGSEYRGRFSQGLFHGYGHLRLAQPYRFTIKGEFEKGRLVTVEDMWFSDGLHIEGSFTGNSLNCDNWKYLTPEDRRYHAEHRYGQPPVGPTSYLTARLLPRSVPKHSYDVEEGMYNEKTSWLVDRPAPLASTLYIGCQGDKDWIRRNCRKARTGNIIEPKASMCRSIIANNLATEQDQVIRTAIYAPHGKVDRKRYYHKMEKMQEHQADQADLKAKKTSIPRPTFRADDPARQTEMCVRAYARVLHQMEQDRKKRGGSDSSEDPKDERIPRPRLWTSTSNVRNPGSGGESSCQSESFGEESVHIKVREDYLSAKTMMEKKTADNFNVVQSNLIRRTSYMDIARSIFEL